MTNIKSNKLVTLVIPTTGKDYERRKWDFSIYFDRLPVKRIVFIGPDELEEKLAKDIREQGEDRVLFVEENTLLPYDNVKEQIIRRVKKAGYGMDENSKPGWYYQQFLKMQYSRICDDDYYLTWDADTIPVRKISMFDADEKPYMDVKYEYCEGYFRTIKNLFGMDKVIKESFISEHMLFNVDLMTEMLNEIEQLNLDGDLFYGKIFNAIGLEDLKRGFAEFETFGTWVWNRHNGIYKIRNWKSLRRGNIFTKMDDLTDEDVKWLGESFDAISFESYHPLIPDLAEMFRNTEYRRKMTAEEFYLTVLKSGIFGEFKDNMVISDGKYWPI